MGNLMLNSVNGIELIQAEIVLEFKGDFKIKTCRCGRTSAGGQSDTNKANNNAR